MTLDEFILRLGVKCQDRSEAELLLAEAQSAFEAFSGPVFPVSDTREYPVRNGVAITDPILAVSGITTTCCSSIAVSGYCLDGQKGEAFYKIKNLCVPRIRVTGLFGSFTTANTPADVKAALINYAKANKDNTEGTLLKEKAGLLEVTYAAWDNSGFKAVANRYRRYF